MDEKKARSLLIKLVNVAYEAGMHSTNPKSLFLEHWKKEGERLMNEIIVQLTSKSSEQHKCSTETHALFRIGGWSICPYCDEDISSG